MINIFIFNNKEKENKEEEYPLEEFAKKVINYALDMMESNAIDGCKGDEVDLLVCNVIRETFSIPKKEES